MVVGYTVVIVRTIKPIDILGQCRAGAIVAFPDVVWPSLAASRRQPGGITPDSSLHHHQHSDLHNLLGASAWHRRRYALYARLRHNADG